MALAVAIAAVGGGFAVDGVSATSGDGRQAPAIGGADAAGLSAGGAAAKPSRAARRCHLRARQRLARAWRGTAARARVRRKLRRCLRFARRHARPPGGGGPAPDPTPGPGTPSPGPDDPGPAPLGSFVGVTASDTDGFRLTLSRPAVAAGSVTVELRNGDSGPHDLAIRPEAGGGDVAQFGPAVSGAIERQQVDLAKGRWYLYCTLPGHDAAGMHAMLRAD